MAKVLFVQQPIQLLIAIDRATDAARAEMPVLMYDTVTDAQTSFTIFPNLASTMNATQIETAIRDEAKAVALANYGLTIPNASVFQNAWRRG